MPIATQLITNEFKWRCWVHIKLKPHDKAEDYILLIENWNSLLLWCIDRGSIILNKNKNEMFLTA